MRQAKNENQEQVSLLLRKGDLAKLRALAAERGFLIPSGPGTGKGSVSHLIRSLLDNPPSELDLPFSTQMDEEEQVKCLQLAWAKVGPLLELIKRVTDAMLFSDLERQGLHRVGDTEVWTREKIETQK